MRGREGGRKVRGLKNSNLAVTVVVWRWVSGMPLMMPEWLMFCLKQCHDIQLTNCSEPQGF